MPVRVVNVTTSSQLVAGSNPNGFREDTSVTNTGTAAAYLDSVQQSDTASGYPLSAGSTVVWQKGRPLYVVAPSSTTLTITENSGALFDAGAIAGQILAQGLAQQIASSIFVTGAPPVDNPAQLLSATFNQDGATHTYGSFDTRGWSSLAWRFRALDPSTTTTPPGTNFLGFYWYDAAGTTVLDIDVINVFGDNNVFSGWEFSSGRLMVKGPKLVVQALPQNYGAGTCSLIVNASTRQIPRKTSWLMNGYYNHMGVGSTCVSFGLDRFVSVTSPAALALGASVAEWIPTRSGLCTATLTYNGTVPANGLDFLVQDLSGVPVAGVRAAGGGAAAYTTQQTFYMPDRPVNIFLRNKGPAALVGGMQAIFTWEPE